MVILEARDVLWGWLASLRQTFQLVSRICLLMACMLWELARTSSVTPWQSSLFSSDRHSWVSLGDWGGLGDSYPIWSHVFHSLTTRLTCPVISIQGSGSTLALVRQNIVEVLYLYAWLENGLELWNGLENGLEFTFFIAIPNSTV